MSQQVQIAKQWMPTALDEFKAITKPREYTDLIKCQSPKFLPFINRYGRPALEELFGRVVMDVAEGLGVTISGNMVADAVDLIVDEFPDTKLSDLLMFKRDLLGGKVGGQVDDKLWKWNTRAIVQAWGEYYAKREDAFCDYREQRHNEAKQEYAGGFAKALANASPEQLEKHREYVAKLEKSAEVKRVVQEKAKEIIPAKLTLEQIAAHEGIDILKLSEAIKAKAEKRRVEEGLTIPMMLILQAEMASTLYEARQDVKYLHELINQTNTIK